MMPWSIHLPLHRYLTPVSDAELPCQSHTWMQWSPEWRQVSLILIGWQLGNHLCSPWMGNLGATKICIRATRKFVRATRFWKSVALGQLGFHKILPTLKFSSNLSGCGKFLRILSDHISYIKISLTWGIKAYMMELVDAYWLLCTMLATLNWL